VPHVQINGEIVYRNTDGFINGEQKPYLLFFPAMTLLYSLLTAFWLLKMRKYAKNTIELHKFILAVLVITTV